ncbi:MAG: hypothetical protein COA78_15090 [Blastopirellula sp.]|nr:MAG: hypothetical protein COA78_15090 [Blastopirellula sp.]
MAWVIGIGIALALLLKFPKPVISLVVLIGIGFGAILLYEEWETSAKRDQKARFTISATTGEKRCDGEYSIRIVMRNGTGRTVDKVTFTLKGYREGYSTPIYSSGYRHYSSDKIMKNKDVMESCWNPPALDRGQPKTYSDKFPISVMLWKAEDKSLKFAD